MRRKERDLLFVGIHNSVVALDTKDGTAVWRAKLGGMSFVNVYWDGVELFASTKGEAFRLDPGNGDVIWHNKLKGLGTGLVTLTTNRAPSAVTGQHAAAQVAREQATAAAAAAS